jgi:hypothetical protein
MAQVGGGGIRPRCLCQQQALDVEYGLNHAGAMLEGFIAFVKRRRAGLRRDKHLSRCPEPAKNRSSC